MGISENLLKAMKVAGLSGIELAAKSGVPTSRISEIITGKTKNPQMKTLVKLADAMRIDVVELTGGNVHRGMSLEEIIDELPADPEYKMVMKEVLKKRGASSPPQGGKVCYPSHITIAQTVAKTFETSSSDVRASRIRSSFLAASSGLVVLSDIRYRLLALVVTNVGILLPNLYPIKRKIILNFQLE